MRHSTFTARFIFASAIFVGAYMTTITVNAQSVTVPDAIQVNEENNVGINGSITEVGDGFLTVEVSGKPMRIDLSRVDLESPASTLFQVGMSVGIVGETEGDYFGVPVIKAKSVSASDKLLMRKTH